MRSRGDGLPFQSAVGTGRFLCMLRQRVAAPTAVHSLWITSAHRGPPGRATPVAGRVIVAREPPAGGSGGRRRTDRGRPAPAPGPASGQGRAVRRRPGADTAADPAQDLPVVGAGRRGWRLTVPGGPVAVEHVLLNDVHGSSLAPARRVRPWIDDRSQVTP